MRKMAKYDLTQSSTCKFLLYILIFFLMYMTFLPSCVSLMQIYLCYIDS